VPWRPTRISTGPRERLSLPAGLDYEATTDYAIDDTEARIAQFR
jgi:hypothetical protein